MTFKPLTEDLGEAVLMSFLEAFPVRTSPAPEKAKASKETDHPCGNTWRESLEKFDLDTHTWKTHQCLWDEDLQPSSVTLPNWGMVTSDGVLWERTTLPRLTSGTGSGSWPTPKSSEPGMSAKTSGRAVEKSTHLTTQVALAEGMINPKTGNMWATPTTMDTLPPKSEKALLREATEVRPGRSKPGNLRDQVSNMKNWPTPQAASSQSATMEASYKEALRLHPKGQNALAAEIASQTYPTPQANEDAAGTPAGNMQKMLGNDPRVRGETQEEWSKGALNPTWVEWLMGWPISWTTLDMNVKPYYDAWHEAQQWTQTGTEEIQSGIMRNVWWDIDPAETPSGREPVQQQSGECDDRVPVVPHQDSLLDRELGARECETSAMQDLRGDIQTEESQESEAMWQAGMPKGEREVISRVAVGIKHRVGRLKAIGNGQVPQVAALAWTILTK